MTNETTNTTTTEPGVFQHPELPQAQDPALNFWAVFLQDEDGTRYAGPTPAIPEWKNQAYILDKDNRWEGTVPLYATNGPEFARMENKKPRIERDGRGRPKHRRVRVWQDVDKRTKKYFEDPDVAATSSRPRVIGAMLWCPNLGPAGLGQEPHGVYSGISEQMPLNMPGKPGQCPKCAGDPLEEARAKEFMIEHYKRAGIDIPKALSSSVADDRLKGRAN